MISDVLCDAREQILNYLVNEPEMYESMESEIVALCAHMTTIITKLNTPPTPEELVEARKAQALRAIAKINQKRIGLPTA